MNKHPATILVVDDDLDVLHTARFILKSQFKTIEVESSPEQLRFLIANQSFDVILLDMNYTAGATSGKEGLSWLKEIKKVVPGQQVIMMTAYGDIKLAVEAMKYGASDFIIKPWENEKFTATVLAAFQHCQSKKEVQKLQEKQSGINQILNEVSSPIIGRSSPMQEVMKLINKVAVTDANVLIQGENGTGKEVIAQEIHRLSDRKSEPFLKVDLGSISDNLFESELFGHKKGAFTDAKEDKPGRLILAGEGTLFLDEIGNLSLSLQAKLLSVLQNRELTPVGGNKSEPIKARILAATNFDLYQMVSDGTFREDLLYRLNTVEIILPPLRERVEDIPLLVDHFLNQFNIKYRKSIKVEEAIHSQLADYHWPGNIRELMHTLERAVILGEGSILKKEDLLLKPTSKRKTNTTSLNIIETEKELIEAAIIKHKGNISKAAKELGLGRTTIYRKMDKYGIQY